MLVEIKLSMLALTHDFLWQCKKRDLSRLTHSLPFSIDLVNTTPVIVGSASSQRFEQGFVLVVLVEVLDGASGRIGFITGLNFIDFGLTTFILDNTKFNGGHFIFG